MGWNINMLLGVTAAVLQVSEHYFSFLRCRRNSVLITNYEHLCRSYLESKYDGTINVANREI